MVPWLIMNATAMAVAFQPHHISREWRFALGSGAVHIIASDQKSTIDQQPIYTLQIIDDNVLPTLTDETKFLGVVAHDMENEGLSPRRIVLIILTLREPDVSRRLSVAASNSLLWTNVNRDRLGEAVVAVLNSIGAYDSFNQVFNQYGLKVVVTHAEYISLVKPHEIGIAHSSASKVPSTATLELVLQKIER